MKLAFCLFHYFPYGGLQRDFLRISRECQKRGHEIQVFTMEWVGELESMLPVQLIEVKSKQNHTRNMEFAEKVHERCKTENYDLVVGFNKMPHLDIYYAADVCYEAKVQTGKSPFYRLLPRYRTLKALEQAVFAMGKKTEILLLSPKEQTNFHHYYQTEEERFHLLPPGIQKDRMPPQNAMKIRDRLRESFDIPFDHYLLLMVGSGFKTKGLDRTLLAFAALPTALRERCHLFVIGEDNALPFAKLARQLKIHSHLQFLGGRKDVPDFLLAADLLLHPAYHENTGTVLLEAMVAGLPVLTTENCGYAHYVSEATAGIVLELPFQQAELNLSLIHI